MIRKEFILNELKYRYPEVRESIRFPREAVGRPLFFEDGARAFGARIILCSARELNQIRRLDQPQTLFLCVGRPDQRVADALDLCVFPEGEERSALFNFIQRLFDRLDEWRQKLKEISESVTDISGLLDCAAQMLQNPIWLCDEKLHAVSCPEHFFEEQRNDETLDSYELKDRLIDSLPQQEGDVVRFSVPDSPDYLISPIPFGGVRFFLICVASERPFYGSDDVVIENLVGFVKMMLSERKLSVRVLRQNPVFNEIEKHIRAIFEHTAVEREEIRALSELGWDGRSDYFVAAAEPVGGDLRTPVLHSLCDKMETAIPGCCAFYEPPYIALVVRAEKNADGFRIGLLREMGEREGIRFGVCETLSGLADLEKRLSVAKEALRRAEGRFAVSFADVAEGYFCDRAVSEYPALLVCMRSVSEMAAYDLEHDSNYLDTVERYLKNRFNAVKTAADLFIHRSTFLYRLERIKDQFGLDLESEQAAPIHLLLSLYLARNRQGEKNS